ncbi:MAG: 30S ribosomal protein S19e [Candidatus Nanoarchaeia archaeon]|nr:30S ribosomal protein S19e [Candidatus Nanoarchaeia archaeon]
MVMYNKNPSEVVNKASLELKKEIKAPEWSVFVKTGVSRERPPEDPDWWYKRAASILRKIYMHGPIGVSKLKTKYGSKKNRGSKPEKFYKASGKIIRTILQQLEQQKLIETTAKGVHKGRIITPKGKSLLDKAGK